MCEAQQEVGPRVVGIRGDELLEISHLLRWLAGRGGLERLDQQALAVRRLALERHRAAQMLEERLWRRGVDREVVVSEREGGVLRGRELEMPARVRKAEPVEQIEAGEKVLPALR